MSARQPFSRGVQVAGVKRGAKKGGPSHPPELDRPVVIRKNTMDVVKPWIAERVTELLGGLEAGAYTRPLFSST
jgi:hypothetical protein